MASTSDKYTDNAPGAFYTDSQCIDCDLCRQTAPAFFDRNAKGGFSFVYKQPQTPEEIALCQQALEECPVEAIGSDGANSRGAAVPPADGGNIQQPANA